MAKAKIGDTVKVHYTGTLEDGREFDSSRDRDPLEFTIGGNQVIKGFEKAVEGLEPGDEITVTIPPSEGYGDYDETLRRVFDISQFPKELDLKPGMMLNVQGENGVATFTVVDILGNDVILDGNPPLVGRDLIFNIKLMEIL
ncbi:MAG TPA: peptidylprolyl isomerase [Thermotogota bacterium]|nr:peptidylprolyl isomerase [Thermotogota bacterium]HPJ88007.1 peptidylprolyl isomerase [Thermotogota bacterium]HPR95094.1 peptidylprolyl isomerase [Thermotogota bacterium]